MTADSSIVHSDIASTEVPVIKWWYARVQDYGQQHLSRSDRLRWESFRNPEDRDRLSTSVRLQHRVARELVGYEVTFQRRCEGCGSRVHGRFEAIPEHVFPCSLSVSHSEDLVVVAAARKPYQVGIDVERKSRLNSENSKFVWSRTERSRWAHGGNPELEEVWTLKEAILKAQGWGLHFPMTDISLHQEGQHLARASIRPSTPAARKIARRWLGQETLSVNLTRLPLPEPWNNTHAGSLAITGAQDFVVNASGELRLDSEHRAENLPL